MNQTEWQQIKAILHQALERAPEQRKDFIAEQCAVEPALMDEVLGLLEADQTLGDFISRPAYLSFVSEASSHECEDLRTGDMLGRYEIVEELGRGGMGTVYLARDDKLNRKVALKVLPAWLHRHTGSTERFQREAHVISALNHPNVLTIHEIGCADSIDFIATEFVDGITLRERIAVGGITIREAVNVGSQMMAGLGAAHAAGFIHRDIKPENIVIRSDGLVKILDFGIAKLADAQESQAEPMRSGSGNLSMGAGTPRYMSPEQLRGDTVDQRCDIWGFGAVFLEMITGRPLLEDLPKALARWQDRSVGPRVQDNVRRFIEKCLEPSVEKRYLSANDVLTDLRRIEEETTSVSRPKRRPYISPRLKLALTAVVIAVLVLSGSLFYNGAFSVGGEGSSLLGIRNIAVLPVVNVDASSDADYFADGLTDELISDLSHIADLRVISRTSVMRYREKPQALPEVARELRVDAVVMSTVRRTGRVVRLSVKLVHASSGRSIWEGAYERSEADLPALRNEITRHIAREISIKLTPREDALLSNSRPVDPEAYDEYLKGRFYLNRRNEESLQRAISHFNASIERDPQFALSYAFLADAYFAMGTEIVSALPPVEALNRGAVSASKAVELDNTLAEAHTALGVIKLYNWQWAEAETSLKRAVELNANYAAAQSWYGLYFVSQGRVGEALACMYRARDLDPLSPHIAQNVGWMLHYAGQHHEEIEQYKRALDLDPNFLFARRRLVGAYRQLGQFDAEVAEAEKVVSVAGRKPVSLILLAGAYASAGRKIEAEKILREVIALKNGEHVSSYALANVYAMLGNKERAFDFLRRAHEEKSYAMVFLKVTKDFGEHFRGDRRFIKLLDDLNLQSTLP